MKSFKELFFKPRVSDNRYNMISKKCAHNYRMVSWSYSIKYDYSSDVIAHMKCPFCGSNSMTVVENHTPEWFSVVSGFPSLEDRPLYGISEVIRVDADIINKIKGE